MNHEPDNEQSSATSNAAVRRVCRQRRRRRANVMFASSASREIGGALRQARRLANCSLSGSWLHGSIPPAPASFSLRRMRTASTRRLFLSFAVPQRFHAPSGAPDTFARPNSCSSADNAATLRFQAMCVTVRRRDLHSDRTLRRRCGA